MIDRLKPGQDSRKNWRTINEVAAGLEAQQRASQDANVIIAEIRRRILDAPGEAPCYRVKERIGDVLRCRTWDGGEEGSTDVFVAVNQDSRYVVNLPSETLIGALVNYTAGTALDPFNLVRIASRPSTSTTENQLVVPTYYLNSVIRVLRTNYSGVFWDDDGTVAPYDLKLVETSARCWAKIAD